MDRSKYIGETLGMGRAISYGSSQLRALKATVQTEECLIVTFVFSFFSFYQIQLGSPDAGVEGEMQAEQENLSRSLKPSLKLWP